MMSAEEIASLRGYLNKEVNSRRNTEVKLATMQVQMRSIGEHLQRAMQVSELAAAPGGTGWNSGELQVHLEACTKIVQESLGLPSGGGGGGGAGAGAPAGVPEDEEPQPSPRSASPHWRSTSRSNSTTPQKADVGGLAAATAHAFSPPNSSFDKAQAGGDRDSDSGSRSRPPALDAKAGGFGQFQGAPGKSPASAGIFEGSFKDSSSPFNPPFVSPTFASEPKLSPPGNANQAAPTPRGRPLRAKSKLRASNSRSKAGRGAVRNESPTRGAGDSFRAAGLDRAPDPFQPPTAQVHVNTRNLLIRSISCHARSFSADS